MSLPQLKISVNFVSHSCLANQYDRRQARSLGRGETSDISKESVCTVNIWISESFGFSDFSCLEMSAGPYIKYTAWHWGEPTYIYNLYLSQIFVTTWRLGWCNQCVLVPTYWHVHSVIFSSQVFGKTMLNENAWVLTPLPRCALLFSIPTHNAF